MKSLIELMRDLSPAEKKRYMKEKPFEEYKVIQPEDVVLDDSD